MCLDSVLNIVGKPKITHQLNFQPKYLSEKSKFGLKLLKPDLKTQKLDLKPKKLDLPEFLGSGGD